MREEIIPRNVAKLVRPPRPARQRREPLTAAQVWTLLDAVAGHRPYAMFVVLSLVDRTLHHANRPTIVRGTPLAGCFTSSRHSLAATYTGAYAETYITCLAGEKRK